MTKLQTARRESLARVRGLVHAGLLQLEAAESLLAEDPDLLPHVWERIAITRHRAAENLAALDDALRPPPSESSPARLRVVEKAAARA